MIAVHVPGRAFFRDGCSRSDIRLSFWQDEIRYSFFVYASLQMNKCSALSSSAGKKVMEIVSDPLFMFIQIENDF
jgi:hypothetical protein